MIVKNNTPYDSSLDQENTARNKAITLYTSLNLIGANHRLKRLANFTTANSETEQSLRKYFNFSYKSSVPALKERERELNFRYGGTLSSISIKVRLIMAKEFVSHLQGSPEELKQIHTLLKHRQLLHDLSAILENQPIELSVPLIQSRIDALSDPESPHVVFVSGADKEYTSFSFPGGCFGFSPTKTHTILFECRLTKENNYFFVIHNRGEGLNDNDIHGPIAIISSTNKKYAKTSVPIRVSKAQILDRKFLTGLLFQLYGAENINDVYTFIKSHLALNTTKTIESAISLQEQTALEKKQTINMITKNIADIQKEPIQTISQRDMLKKLAEEKIKARNEYFYLRLALIQSDNNYHSIQQFGTCVDSCLTGPEKQMASRTLHRKLKLFSIEALAQDLKSATLASPQAEDDKELLLQHSNARALMIQTKLQSDGRL